MFEDLSKYLIFNFFFSLILSLIIIKIYNQKLKIFFPLPKGPQFIHEGKIPRFGGLSIFISFGTVALIDLFLFNYQNNNFVLYFLISIPVFVFGFIEDITQSVPPSLRLFGSFLSGILFIIIFEYSISKIGFEFLDYILNYKVISLLFTIVSIIYLIQAFNIIDGLNGLSIMTAIICLSTVILITNETENLEILKFSMCFISILLGVFICNFPFGKIFIGDSGAYLLGFYVAIILISIVENNYHISPIVIAQILIYPAYETFKSVLRRLFANDISVFKADNKHFHSILYIYNQKRMNFNFLQTNFITSIEIISIQIINMLYIIYFFKSEIMTLLGIIIFILFYEILYKIVNKNIREI